MEILQSGEVESLKEWRMEKFARCGKIKNWLIVDVIDDMLLPPN